VKEMIITNKKLMGHVEQNFYSVEGFVDYQELRKQLHVKVKNLADAIGKTSRSIERSPQTEGIQKGLRKIVYIITLLKEMLPSQEKKEWLVWLKSPHPEFTGLTPWEVIQKGDCDAIIGYLEDAKKGSMT
jgi:hypothetical protein